MGILIATGLGALIWVLEQYVSGKPSHVYIPIAIVGVFLLVIGSFGKFVTVDVVMMAWALIRYRFTFSMNAALSWLHRRTTAYPHSNSQHVTNAPYFNFIIALARFRKIRIYGVHSMARYFGRIPPDAFAIGGNTSSDFSRFWVPDYFSIDELRLTPYAVLKGLWFLRRAKAKSRISP